MDPIGPQTPAYSIQNQNPDSEWKQLFIQNFPEKYQKLCQLILSSHQSIEKSEATINWKALFRNAVEEKITKKIQETPFPIVETDLEHFSTCFNQEGIDSLHVVNGLIYDFVGGCTFRILDPKTGKIVKILEADNTIWSIKIHENKVIAGANNGTIFIWNLESKDIQPTSLFVGNNSMVLFLDVINKSTLVSVSQDGFINIFDLQTGKLIRRIDAYPEDKDEVESDADSDEDRMEVESKASEKERQNFVELVAIVDSKIVLKFLYSELQVWDLETSKLLMEASGEFKDLYADEAKIVGFGWNNSLDFWNPTTLTHLGSLKRSVKASCQKVEKDRIIIGTHSGNIEVLVSGTKHIESKIFKAHQTEVTCIDAIDKTKIVTCAATQTATEVKIWDLSVNKTLLVQTIPYTIEKITVFGKKVILSFEEQKVQIWDLSEIMGF